MKDQVRYQLFLPRAVSERFEALVAKPGVTRSSILAEALTAWLDRAAGDELDQRFGARLDTMSATLARVERNGHVEIETLALFVQFMLTATAPLAADDHAGRAVGRERFEAFIARVGERVGKGKRTMSGAGQP